MQEKSWCRSMEFQKAQESDFENIRAFYWELIDEMQAENDRIGWKKGVYPSDDEYLRRSLSRGELYTLTEGGVLYSCVINSLGNEGYAGVPWRVECGADLARSLSGKLPQPQGRRESAR